MEVTKIEMIGQTKYKIYLDYEYAFLLYKGELKRYHLEEGKILEESVYHDIIEKTVFRRAKQKALAILKYMDRTEYEIRQKLKGAFYTEEIIERTIQYIEQYHYIDDKRYATFYVEMKKNSKSIRQMEMELRKKGVAQETVKEVLETVDDDHAIEKAILKKTSQVDKLSYEEKQKIAGYLYRKGFRSEDIRNHLNM